MFRFCVRILPVLALLLSAPACSCLNGNCPCGRGPTVEADKVGDGAAAAKPRNDGTYMSADMTNMRSR